MFAVGTVLAGKFRVDRVLGRGGMGVVLAATHLSLQQRVALKLLLPELVKNPDVVERFVREARSSAQLRGEHVCRVSDVGALDSGAPYIVMELLDGRDLASLVAANGPIPVPLACAYVLQACLGVAEAHALGIVHRDLKPANLFLTARPDGTPLIKVLDFGIAKAQRDTNFSLTSTSAVLGSPGYMSPEQLRSTKDADRRSDIWSLGVILYELASGKPPFTASSITELALRIAMDPAPPLDVARRMPNGFEAVVMRCLAKEPDERYPDLANLAHALAAYAGNGAWEIASAVSRLVGPRDHRGIAPHAYASAPASGAEPVTIVSTGTNPIGASPAYGSALQVPLPVSPPTTMRSASGSSLVVQKPAGRRWGVVAGVASAIIAGVVTAAVITSSGGGNTETQPAAPPTAGEPAKSDPAKTEPAKADSAAKPDPTTEPKPARDPATDTKTTNTDPTTGPKTKTDPAIDTDTKTATNTDMKTDPASDTKTATKTAAKTPAKTGPKSAVKAVPKPKTDAKTNKKKDPKPAPPGEDIGDSRF